MQDKICDRGGSILMQSEDDNFLYQGIPDRMDVGKYILNSALKMNTYVTS